MNSYDMRGRLVAQAFFSEFEKIAKSRAAHIADVVLENRTLAKQLEPDLWEKLKPGTGSFFEALRDRSKARGYDTELTDRAMKDLRRMRSSLDPSAAKTPKQRAAMMRQLIDIQNAEDRLRSRTGSFSGGWGSPKPDAPPPPPTPAPTPTPAPPEPPRGSPALRNLAVGTGLGAAGILGAQYYLSPGEPQY